MCVSSAEIVSKLEACPAVFILPRNDFLAALVPSIAASSTFDCMMGYFASSSLAQIAPGLATFLRSGSGTLRLIVSPVITQEDQAALARGLSGEDLALRAFADGLPDADDLTKQTLDCLAWLVREGRLDMRFAFLRNGIFHPKVWLMNVSGHRVAFHGSSNMTGRGLSRNREQIAISRAWMDSVQEDAERRVREEFNLLWDDDDDEVTIVKLPKAVEQRLLSEFGKGSPPTEADTEQLWRRARGTRKRVESEHSEARVTSPPQGFAPPIWLNNRSGAFAHQGRAIDAWLAANGRGILAMATGSGKTLTSLAACHELHKSAGPLLLVIGAPYVPLIMQWCDEVRLFGIEPRNMTAAGGPKGRKADIAEAARNLSLGLTQAEALVVSHDTLTDADFCPQLAGLKAKRVLIADEMHNLGSPTFLSSPPEFFEYRLGLSATPIRQYDPEGTDRLFDFFGPPCFEFTLEEAIGVCLVPYDYYVHPVSLTADEMELFRELTEKIRNLAWQLERGEPNPHLDNLLRQRRLIVETAGGKITKLAQLIDAEGAKRLRYELIYATDKAPAQLQQVNDMLRERGVLYHQLTAEETCDKAGTSRLLKSFQDGDLQVLTAKRVLDEGVNVPQIERAFILASTTVERQWVQRRGRILRRCDAIGKDHGVIHDFVAMPPPDLVIDPDAKTLVKGELKRVEEFARLARNYGAKDGPLAVLTEMQSIAYGI
jgi:superfamily II DNA or RNA helicase